MRARLFCVSSALLCLAACMDAKVDPSSPPTTGSAPLSTVVAAVTMVYQTVELLVGEERQLQATPRTLSGKPTGATAMTWSSTAPAIATVTPNGLVSAVSPGTARIVVNVDGFTAETVVTVKAGTIG